MDAGVAIRAPAPERASSTSRLSLRALVVWGAIGAGVAAGIAIVAFDLAQHNALTGITEYDDGVYLASAMRLLAGHLPYRSFTFLQPPGIAVVFLPAAIYAHFAGSRAAMAAARVATALVTGANAGLCGTLVRHRGGFAALTASLVLALYPPAMWADHTAMLEPYLVFFTLIGANLAFRRGVLARRGRLIGAGVAFGLAGSIKIWGLLAAAALCLCIAYRFRDALAFGLATLAGLVVCCGPFFLAAPGAFWRQVVVAQLTRQAASGTTVAERLFTLAGVRGLNFTIVPKLSGSLGPLILLSALGFVVVLVVVPRPGYRPRPLEFFVVISAIATSLTVLVPTEFYSHYVYYPAAFIAVALGLAIGSAAELVAKALALLPRPARLGLTTAVVTVALLASGSVIGAAAEAETTFSAKFLARVGDPGPIIAASVPKGACTITDAEVLLVAANRVAESPSCPTIIDSTGVWLAADPTHPPRSPGAHPHLVADWQRWFSQSDYVVMSSVEPFRIPWTPQLRSWFLAHFHRLPVAGAAIFERDATAAHGT